MCSENPKPVAKKFLISEVDGPCGCPAAYSVDVDRGLVDGPRSFQPVPRLMPIVTAIISAAAVALHQIKRREGSEINGRFAILKRVITDIIFEIADCSIGVRVSKNLTVLISLFACSNSDSTVSIYAAHAPCPKTKAFSGPLKVDLAPAMGTRECALR